MRTRYIVAVIVVGALALRVAAVQSSSYRPINDAHSYLVLASQIAHTGDYSGRNPGAGGSRGPTAYFAPGYPYFLSVVDVLDGHRMPGGGAVEPARLAQALLGTIVVGLIGLIAVELFGETIALIALALAALYPPMIELSSVLVAEVLLVVLELAAVWAVLRARRSGRPYRWYAAAGLLTGLATLTHVNGIVLVLPLGFAAWRLAEPAAGRRRLAAPAVLIAAVALTIAPWTIRNAIVLHRVVPVSDETGITLAGTYNPTSAHDPAVPYRWRFYTKVPAFAPIARSAARSSEPALSDRLQSRALHYVGDHPFAPLAVAFHNTLRLLELEGSVAWRASTASIGLSRSAATAGVLAFWLVCLLALGGLLTATTRTVPRWLWGVPLLFALSVIFVNVETPRFRAPVDPFLILLAACTIAAIAERVGLLGRAPVGRRLEPAASAGGAEGVEVVERLP